MCAHPTLFLLSSNTRAAEAEAEAWANVQAEDLDAATTTTTTTKRKTIDLAKRIDIQYLFIFLEFKAVIRWDGNNTNAAGLKRESAGANKIHCQHFSCFIGKITISDCTDVKFLNSSDQTKKSLFSFSAHYKNLTGVMSSITTIVPVVKKKNHRKHLVWLKLQIFWLILNIYSYARNNESSENYKYPVDPHKNCIVLSISGIMGWTELVL